MLQPRLDQKEPPRLGSTTCYGQALARTEKATETWPERASETLQYDLLRPNMGQKEPPRFGGTVCYGQTWARKSHRDTAVRFVTARSGPERATETRQYDLIRSNVGQKEPPRLGSTICCGQEELSKKSHQDSAVRFVAAKRGPERATKTRQYLLPPNVGHRDSAVRFITAKKSCPKRATESQEEPPSLGSTICYGQTWARKSHRHSAIRFFNFFFFFVSLLQPRVGHKEQPRLGSTICYGQTWARKSHQDSEPSRLGSTISYGQELARKSHQDSAVRFMVKRGPERAIETRQYDLLRPNVGQKEPPRLGSTICNSQELARKSHRDSAVRLVTVKCGPERATKSRDLLRPRVGHQDSAVWFVAAKSGPERSTKTRQYDLIRPRIRQKEPPRLGNTICYGQTWAERATKTRQ